MSVTMGDSIRSWTAKRKMAKRKTALVVEIIQGKIREQYDKQRKDSQEAYGEAMLELRAREKLQALMERPDHCPFLVQ